VSARVAISGEISLLWQDVDPYAGDVILMNIIPDEMLRMDTFELRGPLAARFKDGVLAEGMRVEIHCVTDTIEVVNRETGETSDEDRPVVVDILVLDAGAPRVSGSGVHILARGQSSVGRSQVVRQRVLVPRSEVRILPPQPGRPTTRRGSLQ
jgi:hypothetical protein